MSLNTAQVNTPSEENSESTLNQIFAQHADALRGYIGKRVSDMSQVDDLLQDLFIKLQALNLEDIQYPKAYLYRMANNLIIDQQRKQSRFVDLPDEGNIDIEDPRSPESILQQKQRLSAVRTALQELPSKTRDAFCMLRLQQMDKQQVAQQLDVSVNMVEKHVRKALDYCQMKLKKSE